MVLLCVHNNIYNIYIYIKTKGGGYIIKCSLIFFPDKEPMANFII